METPTAGAQADIHELLKAFKEKAGGEKLTTTLPVLGATVAYPAAVTHNQVMAASKLAGKNLEKIGIIVVAQHCTFNGKRLTVDEIGAMPNRDVGHLVGLVLGDGEDGEAGN